MATTKIHDIVKRLLEDYPQVRGDNKKLEWAVWGTLGYVDVESRTMARHKFYEAPDSAT